MQRKEFIKLIISRDYKLCLRWAGILFVAYFLLFSDLPNFSWDIIKIIEIVGLFIIIFGLFYLFVLGLKFILEKAFKLLPQTFSAWLKKNKKQIEILLIIFLWGYLIYDMITNKKYGYFVFGGAYLFLVFLFREDEKKK